MKKLISLAAAAAILGASTLALAGAGDQAPTTPSKMEESKTVNTTKDGMTTTETKKKEVVDGKTVEKKKEVKKTDAAGNVVKDDATKETK